MAYKINGTQVIDDDGNLVNFSAYNLNNDDGQIEIQSNSPMVGTVSGYTSGGSSNIIDKFPFAADLDATDVGDLTVDRIEASGQSSETNGYTSGGQTPATVVLNTIDKFPFASNANATDVGNLSVIRRRVSGQSSFTHGYTAGGLLPPGPASNTIDKFPFSADSNATDVGDLTGTGQADGAGASSSTFGYIASGLTIPPVGNVGVNTIQKFSFAVNNNASDVGDLNQEKLASAGHSSATHGYVSGGNAGASPPFTATNTIEKYPFSSDTNATDIADLSGSRTSNMGQSSVSFGYSTGGSPNLNIIDKFSFVTDTDAVDIANLSAGRQQGSGQQD
jgi:hypothetical protein